MAVEQAGQIVFLRRVVHQVRRFHHVARHGIHIAEIVDEAGFFRIDAGEDAAAEHIGKFFFHQPFAAAFAHGFDKLAVNLVEHVLPNGLLFGRFGHKRVTHALVVARNTHAAADAQFFNQAGRIKAAADDADTAHQAGRVGKDFVGGGGNVVAARCAHVFGDDIHGDIRVFRLDAADFGKRGVGHDG